MPETNSVTEGDHPGGRPPFWNERYVASEALFGTAPNAFIREQANRVPRGARVAEVGAGEARNLIFLARERGAQPIAVDLAEDGLRAARERATAAGLSLGTVAADARTWQPAAPFDAVVVTFLHLLPEGRVQSYRRLREALRPGGLLLAEWFSTDHANQARFAEVGPPPDRLISLAELRRHFDPGGRAAVRVAQTAGVRQARTGCRTP